MRVKPLAKRSQEPGRQPSSPYGSVPRRGRQVDGTTEGTEQEVEKKTEAEAESVPSVLGVDEGGDAVLDLTVDAFLIEDDPDALLDIVKP